MAFLSRILILLAIVLYEQLLVYHTQAIYHTHASLRPNTQYLSAQQYFYQSFLVTSLFDFVCVQVARWENLRQNVCINMSNSELNFSLSNIDVTIL